MSDLDSGLPLASDAGGASPSNDGGGDRDGTTETDSGTSAPPANAYCAPTKDWPAARVALEQQVVVLMNEQRAQGANCGSRGPFAPTEPLQEDASLYCAGRMHSADMYERDYFDHTNPDGEEPNDRMKKAGYSGRGFGENIFKGVDDPEAVVAAWMDSGGHCANIMNPDFVHVGIGTSPDERIWTATFGIP